MKVIYTKHAEDKLKHSDVRKFKITKKTIEEILKNPEFTSRTQYGDYAAVSTLDATHDLRVIYGIIGNDRKVITFHVARKGRYR